MIIGTFEKQPGEILDYSTSLKPWLPKGDLAVSAEATADAGITIQGTVIESAGRSIVVWLSGGMSGQKYKIQVKFVTNQGRTKEYEFIVKVKEQ